MFLEYKKPHLLVSLGNPLENKIKIPQDDLFIIFLSLFIHYVLTSTLKSSTNLLQLHNYSNLFTLISDILHGIDK